jgi:hypothetical protein
MRSSRNLRQPSMAGRGLTLGILVSVSIVLAGDRGSAQPSGSQVKRSPLLAAVPDGAWQQFPSPTWLIWHAAIYDPGRDRMIVQGGMDGFLPQDELWELPLAGDVGWRKLPATGTLPPHVRSQGAVYDPVRDRMLVFGGSTYDLATAPVYFNRVFALSLAGDPQWTEIATLGLPPEPRHGRGMVYDSVADRLLIFGDRGDAGVFNDTWSLSLSGTPAWSRMTVAGTPPAARSSHSCIFDPVRNRVVLFGGATNTGEALTDVWQLSLAGSPEWTQIAPSGTPPHARFGQAALYDPAHDRMVVFNGAYTRGGSLIGIRDAWTLSLDAAPVWAPLAATGAAHPGGSGGSAVFDTQRGRALLYGGWTGDVTSVYNDVWSVSLDAAPQWSQAWVAHAPRATGRVWHSAVRDPVRNRMIVFGGLSNWVGELNPNLQDTWTVDLGATTNWSELSPTGTPPSGRYGHTAIYDPVRDRMVVFGGINTALLGDVAVLSLAGTPTWGAIPVHGVIPNPRHGHTAIYDPVRDQMVIFGGVGAILFDDLWTLSLSGTPTWTRIPATGGPSARTGHTAIYDPSQDRMIVFGGTNGVDLGDVWQLSLSGLPTWSRLDAGGTPPAPRHAHTAVFDAVRNRMVVYGGISGSTTLFNDLQALDLGANPAWKGLDAASQPAGPFGHAAVYDPTRDGMWVYGGQGGGANELWTYWPAGEPTEVVVQDFALDRVSDAVAIHWTIARRSGGEEFRLLAARDGDAWQVPVESQSGNEFVAWDHSPEVVSGGLVQYSLAYRDAGSPWVFLAAKSLALRGSLIRTRLLEPYPNPARARVDIPFVLARDQLLRISVYDVGGHEVARVVDGRGTAGAGRVTWSGLTSAGRPATAGAYIVRLETRDGRQARKVVLR